MYALRVGDTVALKVHRGADQHITAPTKAMLDNLREYDAQTPKEPG